MINNKFHLKKKKPRNNNYKHNKLIYTHINTLKDQNTEYYFNEVDHQIELYMCIFIYIYANIYIYMYSTVH